MGKYEEYIEEKAADNELSDELEGLYLIANELAEANRLKRWEIKLSHKEIKDTTVEQELEDQA